MLKRITLYVFLSVFLVVGLLFLKVNSRKSSITTAKSTMTSNPTDSFLSGQAPNIVWDIGRDDIPPDIKDDSLLTKAEYNLKATFLSLFFNIFASDADQYLHSKNIDLLVKKEKWPEVKVLLKLFGPEKVMQEVFAQSKKGKGFNCHGDGHYIGRLSYNLFKEKAVKSITICASGYVHGVLGTFIKSHGVKNYLTYVPKVCESFKTIFEKQQCYHASGHGIMGGVNNNLLLAVDLCSKYYTDFQKINCYAGAFMENYAPVTRKSSFPPKTKWVDAKKPHFPCNQFPENPRAGIACYSVQFPWVVLVLLEKDIKEMPKFCLGASQELIGGCFFGYGQYAALISNQNPKELISLCKLSPDDNLLSFCLWGGQQIIMDYWGTNLKNQGKNYCDQVPESYKQRCIATLNDRMKQI